jgi:hypothetical protein
MKPKIKDVHEPFNTLVQLVMKYGMAEVLNNLAAVAGMVAQNEQDERNITEAEWLRAHLIRAAERTDRFNKGEPKRGRPRCTELGRIPDMTEKQADTLLEMLDRIAVALEKLVQLKQGPQLRQSSEDPPAWTKNLPPRKQPPETEL